MDKKSRGPKKPFAYKVPGSGSSQRSVAYSSNSDNSMLSADGGLSGERVKVAVRIRPLMKHERGHK